MLFIKVNNNALFFIAFKYRRFLRQNHLSISILINNNRTRHILTLS